MIVLALVILVIVIHPIIGYQSFQQLPELHYDLEIHSQGHVLARQTISVIYSKQFFQSYKDKLSIELQIPTSQLPFAYLMATLRHNYLGKNSIIKKQWKLTKNMPQIKKSFEGIQQIFGIKNIIVNKYTAKTAYLKIVYNQPKLKSKSINLQQYHIDQNQIIDSKSYIPIQSINSESFKLKVTPSLIIKGHLYKLFIQQQQHGQQNKKYDIFNQLDDYYLKLMLNNKTSFDYQINITRQLYNKIIKDSQIKYKNIASKIEDLEQRKLMQQQLELVIKSYKSKINNLTMIAKDLDQHGSVERYKQIMIVICEIAISIVDMIKKIIFFNQSGYYTIALIAFLPSALLIVLFRAALILNILFLAYNYQKHVGLSLIIFYLQIFYYLFDYLHYGAILPQYIIYVFILIALIFIQKCGHFPYYTFGINKNYEKHLPFQKHMFMIISAISFALFIGAYLFYRLALDGYITKQGNSAFAIYSNIYDQYYMMFGFMSQIYMNHKLKTVKHLTKWYVIIAVGMVLSDNGLILLHLNPTNIFLKLKQDIMICILIHQIMEYEDLGSKTNKDTNKAIEQSYKKREQELLTIINKDD